MADDFFKSIGIDPSKFGQGAMPFSVNGRSTYGARPTGGSTVWLGETEGNQTLQPKGPYAPGYKPSATPFTGGKKMVSFDEAALAPRDWTDKQKREFVNKGILYKIPGFSPDMGDPEIFSAWDDLINSAWMMSSEGREVSPWQVMDSYAKEKGKYGTVTKDGWVYDVATGERIAYKGELTKKTKQTNVNLSSPEDVRVIATQALREALGRAPTDKELAQFRSAIGSLEQASPEVRETTTTLKPNLETGQLEEVGSSSTVTGGVSEAARAAAVTEAAQKSPEYGKYQGGTTYFNALMQMISGG